MADLDGLWSALADELTDVMGRYRQRIATLPVTIKPDRTILTAADVEVEELITARIREFDPDAVIIGEEDGRTDERAEVTDPSKLLYVIDPIDGTAEFVRPGHREFASVVCVLRDRRPVAAFVLAPELGTGGTPLLITCDQPAGSVKVNGARLGDHAAPAGERWASVTRSSGTEPRAFEAQLQGAGFRLKTRTTSQTLDMVRASIDVSQYSDARPAHFTLFYRSNQKIWDGLAGLCLGETVGLRTAARTGAARVPVDVATLRAAEPTFDSTILGSPEAVEWFLKTL
ncbi:3'(2'), 5'-bisphosphate nucleotidase [Catenuloplanes nepalensis]|uniref:3'(2'), 5'-bisphosphate nucleotidase n=1 Tax=Catenuloplanes nepalensis TaxID=587533 RepID=A0ABT9MZK7_9ACTN|nr:inositol monophosphatase family protein [Catenuloplanes nepalensis]MDP9796873.1 3'(2'), 5'-bisphosphate nucleotidase [Catenuloplanes nepalensis]